MRERTEGDAAAEIAGRVLLLPAGRGSSSGSASLAEAIRLGCGPAAILLLKRDGIVVVGALAAAELYRIVAPVVLIAERDWASLAASRTLRVRAEADAARIESVS